ncbi:NAD(P)-dependent oxidoreductase [Micromonospora qiuiae]|nr:NAD(P)-dependent oxidoreductase [Micromonospora qiuiae]
MTDIAVLGTGRMGTAVARRLLAGGNRVSVWNRTPTKARALAAAGAHVATTPAAAVARADLVLTLLTDAAAVEATLFGADSTLAALRSGAIVVQMSTIAPDEMSRIAARLPASVPLLDAPVGGSVDAVTAGELTIFAGGPAAIVDLAEPVLRDLGTIRRCGPVGAGAALKLVVNTALVTALGALHDTLVVADGLGVDRAVALDALAAGPLGSAIRRATASGASFPIALAVKDGRLALGAAGAAPVAPATPLAPATPVAVATLHLLDAAADQGADVSSLITLENR